MDQTEKLAVHSLSLDPMRSFTFSPVIVQSTQAYRQGKSVSYLITSLSSTSRTYDESELG
jgi:hypothetical protein